MTNFIDETNLIAEEESTLPPFNRDEWIQQKKAEREKAFEMVRNVSDMLPHDAERFKNCLDLISRFGRYSVSNILLLEAQKPDAKELADFQTWKDKGESIKKGETGIMILEPGKEYTRKDGKTAISYNVKRVFDISQTSLPFGFTPYTKRDGRLLIRSLVQHAPCRFESVDASQISNGRSAYYDAEKNTIYAVPGTETSQLFRDMAAVLSEAHLELGEYSTDHRFGKMTCVSYILCVRNQIDTSDFDFSKLPPYVQEMNGQQMREYLGDIRDVANAITRDMDRFFEKMKGAPERDDAR